MSYLVSQFLTYHGMTQIQFGDLQEIHISATHSKILQANNCDCFFTSDELPRYGIGEREIQFIYLAINKKKGDGQLIIMMAYPRLLATQIRIFLIDLFHQQVQQK